MALRAHVHREEPRVPLGLAEPAGRDLRRQRGREPGVEDVFLGPEPAGPVALLLAVARRHGRDRVDRQARLVGEDRLREVGRPVGGDRVPQRERHAEVALTADAPVEVQVLGPVAEAQAHEVGVPLHLLAGVDERLLVLEDLHEPLPRGHELEGPVALLVELHGVLERARLGDERRLAVARGRAARVAQQLDDPLLRLADRLADELAVGGRGRRRVEARPALGAEVHRHQPPVAADDLPQRELLLAPPLHVGRVAERADHQDARALLAVDELAREDRHRHAEERRHGPLAEESLVPVVLGVRGHADARRQQLGPRRRDHERPAALDAEADVVEGAPHRAVLDLRLGHRRAEVHVPQRGRLDLVDLPLAEQVEEAPLRRAARVLVDRRVLEAPVDRQGEPAPQSLERLLVLDGEGEAQLDEVGPRHLPGRQLARGVVRHAEGQPRLVRHVRLALHVEVVLDPALGRQAVVVPAHRVEHVLPAHAVVAREHVRLRVAEHVPDVQRAGNGRRRRVDDVRLARPRLVEAVDPPLLPDPVPLVLRVLRLEVGAQTVGVDGDRHGRHVSSPRGGGRARPRRAPRRTTATSSGARPSAARSPA